MRTRIAAAAVTAAALLAACSDTPTGVRKDPLYDMSNVRVTRGTPVFPEHRVPNGTRRICYQDYCDPMGSGPEAVYDYGSFIDTSNDGTNKSATLTAWSDNYSDIQTMTITGSFKSAGGQGPSGCSATVSQFDSETQSGAGTPWGDHLTLYVTRTATYASSQTWIWQVDGTHYFRADFGYTVDGTYRAGTFYSTARTCL